MATDLVTRFTADDSDLKSKIKELKQAILDLHEKTLSLNLTQKGNSQQVQLLGQLYQSLSKQMATVVTECDQLNKKMDKTKYFMTQLQGSLTLLGGQFGSTAAGLVSMAGHYAPWIAAIAAAGKAVTDSVKYNYQLEQSLSYLRTLLRSSAEDMKYYREQAIELGRTTPQTPEQIADAFVTVAKMKPELADVKENLTMVTSAAVDLANALKISVSEAADALTRAINVYGDGAFKAQEYANLFDAAARKGSGDVTWMSTAFGKAGATAKASGLSFQDTATALELLSRRVKDSTSAGAQLRNVLIYLNTDVDESLRPATVGMSQAIKNLRDQFQMIEDKGDRVAFLNKKFRKTSIEAAQALIDYADEFDTLNQKIRLNADVSESAEMTQENLAGAVKRLQSAWQSLILSLGNSTGPLATATDMLAELLNKMSGYDKVRSNWNKTYTGQESLTSYRWIENELKKDNTKTDEELIKGFKQFQNSRKKLLQDSLDKLVEEGNSWSTTAISTFLNTTVGSVTGIRMNVQDNTDAKKQLEEKIQAIDETINSVEGRIKEVRQNMLANSTALASELAEAARQQIDDMNLKELEDYSKKLKKEISLVDPDNMTQYLQLSETIKQVDAKIKELKQEYKVTAAESEAKRRREAELNTKSQMFDLNVNNGMTIRYLIGAEDNQLFDTTDLQEALKDLPRDMKASMNDIFERYKGNISANNGLYSAGIIDEDEYIKQMIEDQRTLFNNMLTELVNAMKAGTMTADNDTITPLIRNIADILQRNINNRDLARSTTNQVSLLNTRNQTINKQLMKQSDRSDNITGLSGLESQQDRLIEILTELEQIKEVYESIVNNLNLPALLRDQASDGLKQTEENLSSVGQQIEENDQKISDTESAQKLSDTLNGVAQVGQSIGSIFEATGNQTAAAFGQILSSAMQLLPIIAELAISESVENATRSSKHWIELIAAIGSVTATVIAALSKKKNYATGGIVGGNSYHGDTITAGLNSGEMVLNRTQQSNLFKLLNGQAGTTSNSGNQERIFLKGSDIYISQRNYAKKQALVGKNI